MYQATTMPYVKKLGAFGEVTNPLSNHVWDGNNRKTRREKQPRAFNNSKNHQMVVNKTYRWNKTVQFVMHGKPRLGIQKPFILPNGKHKRINHLVFSN
jgi:hypothetical protein